MSTAPNVHVELTVRVDAALAAYLAEQSMAPWPPSDTPGRFLRPGNTPLAETRVDAWPADGGSLHWCETAADWLLLEAFERASGHQTLLALDEATPPGFGPYVLWSSRPFDDRTDA